MGPKSASCFQTMDSVGGVGAGFPWWSMGGASGDKEFVSLRVPAVVVWVAVLLMSTGPATTETVVQRYNDASNTMRSGGSQCNTCCRGPPGTQGMPGMPGMQGTRGQDGRTGVKGDRGEPGNTGYPGDRGDTGLMGAKGHRGRKGTKGECGPPGVAGVKGEEGPTGPPGPIGVQGTRGPKGEQPARIAFTVTRKAPMGPVPQTTPVTFDNVHLNLGDGFDVFSSHFICKVNGTYLFTVHMMSAENQTAYGWLMYNNVHQVAFHGDAAARYGTGSNTIILKLVKDDHVWVQLETDSAIINDLSSFSGHILFED